MKIQRTIMTMILSLFNLGYKHLKVKENKIAFISLENNKLENDFKLVSDELTLNYKYDIEYILFKFDNNLIGKFKYLLYCIRQLKVINTSKLIILDYNNFVVCNFKKNETKILQLWHASGAIKKFGSAIKRDYEINNYDYVIASSDYYKDIYAKSFNVNQENVIVSGIPKCDILFNKMNAYSKRDFLRKELLKSNHDKKIVLYAPTFRGKLLHGLDDNFNVNLNRLQQDLGDEYLVIYKLHPLLQTLQISESEKVLCLNHINIDALLSISDILISDYSSIILDYSILHKPVIFFVPDLKEYEITPGLNIEIHDLYGPVCYDENELLEAIKNLNYDDEQNKKVLDKYFKYHDGCSTKRVCALIEEIMEKKNSTK